jgi:hypothetical protein
MLTEIQLLDWLLDNAGEVIKYRVSREFMPKKASLDNERIQTELLENPDVQMWLKNLKPELPFKWNLIHGSFDWQYENAMLKILQLGLHAGIPQVDEITKYYIKYLETESSKTKNKRELFDSIIVASMLLTAGYTDNIVLDFMKNSLDVLSKFTDSSDYDIYVENREDYKGLPKNWKDSPIIKPQLLKEYGFCYPMVYDLIGLSSMYRLGDCNINEKIDSVIKYIVSDDFHNKIKDGYGILVTGQGRYRSMGWDPKLPGYFNISDYARTSPHKLVFFANIISRYPIAVESRWYSDVIEHLEQFKTEIGTYCFPKEYLREKSGYAVQGFHLGLGENKRKKIWCEVESTFIMLILKKAL